MASNAWLRLRYTIWAPHYDKITKFPRERKRSVDLLALQPGERLILIGCGTGADLPFVPEGVEVLAVDLTPAMLEQARAHARPGIEFRVLDGLAVPVDPVRPGDQQPLDHRGPGDDLLVVRRRSGQA